MSEMTEETTERSAGPPPEEHVRGTGWIASKVPLVVAIVAAGVFWSQTGDMEVGSLTEPGPGFWPRVLLIGIVVSSAAGLAVDLRDGIEPFLLGGTARVAAGFGTLVVFTVLFEQTGMILAGVVFMVLWLKGLNGESWRLTAVLSIVSPLVCYLLFVTALGVRLPEDVVASLWGGR